MGTGRFWATAIAVWLVRTVMNALFYGVLLAPRLAAVAAQHPARPARADLTGKRGRPSRWLWRILPGGRGEFRE